MPDGQLLKHVAGEPPPAGGILFHSKKEARRWVELKAQQAAGRIQCLERQRRIKLKVNGHLIATYTADATYIENGLRVIEDTKSPRTRILSPYVMKKKLILALLGIYIRET